MSELIHNRKIAPPNQQEQAFIYALSRIRAGQLTDAAELQGLHLYREFQELAEALLDTMRDYGEEGFWTVYDTFCLSVPRMTDFRPCVLIPAPLPEPEPEEPYSGVMLSTVQAQSIEWLWKGYIPLGKLTILEGDPGLGKSSILLDLAARVSWGAAMPDETIALPEAGGVVLVMNEDGLADTIRPRLEKAQADMTRIVSVGYIPTVDASSGARYERAFNLAEDLAVLERAVIRCNAKLVVIDPVMAVLGGKDTYKDNEVRSFLAPLAELCERLHFACILVRHLTKSNGSNPLYNGNGSVAFIALARTAMLVVRDPNDSGKCVLHQTKNNISKLAPALSFSITSDEAANDERSYVLWHGISTHTLQELVSPASTDKYVSPRQQILCILQESYPVALMLQELQEELPEMNASTLRSTLKRMVEDRQIERSARGAYVALSE